MKIKEFSQFWPVLKTENEPHQVYQQTFLLMCMDISRLSPSLDVVRRLKGFPSVCENYFGILHP